MRRVNNREVQWYAQVHTGGYNRARINIMELIGLKQEQPRLPIKDFSLPIASLTFKMQLD